MSLYKYTSAEGAAYLSKHTLRFSIPTSFNDPFDGLPETSAYVLNNPVHQTAHGKLRRLEQDALAVGNSIDAHEFARGARKFTEDAILGVLKKREQDRENFRVLCLSMRKPTSTAAALMWGHYATETRKNKKGDRPSVIAHAGLALEFDDTHPWFEEHKFSLGNGRHFRGVDYLSRRPSIESDGINGYFIKSRHWRYEKEVRLIRMIKGFPGHEDQDVLYPSEMLRSVTVGVSASDKTVATIKTELNKNHNFGHVKLFRLRVHPDKYQFIRVPEPR